MSDINLFELGGKTIRRSFEAFEDSDSLTAGFINDTRAKVYSVLFKTQTGGDVRLQQSNITNQAFDSLSKDDPKEAAHQFRREIYFDSLTPDKISKPQDQAAKAALKAVEEHKSPGNIARDYNNAFYKTELDDIATQQRDLDQAMEEIKKHISGK